MFLLSAAQAFTVDREMYPFAAHTLEVDGGRLHYVDEGAGSPILFVHGTPSWSFEWRKVITGLSGTHRCVAPDHIGYGLSDHPADWSYRPEDHAANLGRLVEALDLRDITLVVHDVGGPIGLGWAVEHTDRVRRVVAVNTFAWAVDDPKVGRIRRLLEGPLGRWMYLSLNASPRWIVPAALGKGHRLTPAEHAHYTEVFPTRESRIGAWRAGIELDASRDWYGRIWDRRETLADKPWDLVWGMADTTFTPTYLAQWRAAFPAASVTELAGVGHFPAEEAPDALIAALR
jgi:haloalkane dehalogenase